MKAGRLCMLCQILSQTYVHRPFAVLKLLTTAQLTANSEDLSWTPPAQALHAQTVIVRSHEWVLLPRRGQRPFGDEERFMNTNHVDSLSNILVSLLSDEVVWKRRCCIRIAHPQEEEEERAHFFSFLSGRWLSGKQRFNDNH